MINNVVSILSQENHWEIFVYKKKPLKDNFHNNCKLN